MSESFTFFIDGVPVEARPGMTILEAAQGAVSYTHLTLPTMQ